MLVATMTKALTKQMNFLNWMNSCYFYLQSPQTPQKLLKEDLTKISLVWNIIRVVRTKLTKHSEVIKRRIKAYSSVAYLKGLGPTKEEVGFEVLVDGIDGAASSAHWRFAPIHPIGDGEEGAVLSHLHHKCVSDWVTCDVGRQIKIRNSTSLYPKRSPCKNLT